jgi:hypothetical protein
MWNIGRIVSEEKAEGRSSHPEEAQANERLFDTCGPTKELKMRTTLLAGAGAPRCDEILPFGDPSVAPADMVNYDFLAALPQDDGTVIAGRPGF